MRLLAGPHETRIIEKGVAAEGLELDDRIRSPGLHDRLLDGARENSRGKQDDHRRDTDPDQGVKSMLGRSGMGLGRTRHGPAGRETASPEESKRRERNQDRQEEPDHCGRSGVSESGCAGSGLSATITALSWQAD
jgi:hypothetical protein